MKLNLYDILTNVLNESVQESVIIDAINNKNVVYLNYTDEEAHATGRRTLEPYMLFINKSNNLILLVYQWEGDTYRGKPSWKTLRVDRINDGSWKTLKNKHFKTEPKERFMSAPAYKDSHKYATEIISMVNFNSDDNELYQPSLDIARKNTQAIKNNELPSMDLSKLDVMPKGPIKQKKNNIYTSRPNSKKYGQFRQNVANTERDAEERQKYWGDYDKAEQEMQKQNQTDYEDDFDNNEIDNQRGPIRR